MTERQRDYLADLAAKKAVILDIPANMTTAEASAKIKELKEKADAVFLPLSDDETEKIDNEIKKIINDVQAWEFA